MAGTSRSSWEREDTSDGSLYLMQILRLHNAGVPSTLIGKKFGKDHSTILYHLRKLGVPRGLGRGHRREMIHIEVEITTAQRARHPAPVPQSTGKVGKYDHLIEEPVNPGKSYREYLKAGGKTPKQIRRMMAEKTRAASLGGSLVEASLRPTRTE